MSGREGMDIGRRKALLTTASISGAFVSFSNSAVASGGSKESSGKNRNAPSNENLPPAARNKRPETMPVSKGELPENWIDSEGNLSIPESELEEAFGVQVYDGRTGAELEDVETNVVNINKDQGLLDRYQDDFETQGVRFDRTLWHASASGHTMKLKGSFDLNVVAPEASVNLRLEFNDYGFDVISLGITPSDNRLFCIEPKAHPAIPLEIAICPDLYWRYGSSKFDIGGSGDACIGYDCPWATCNVCRGVSFNTTIDIDDYD